MDTIYALASARGRAGVSIVRISGPKAWEVVRLLAGVPPEPRRVGLRRLRVGEEVLDEALVVVFERGSSFTGEEAAEFHLHGSVAVVSAVLRALGNAGLRLAEAGEFTRRALENGRIDLAQVEGLADLIDAETEAQRKQALRVMSGAIGKKAEGWRRDLVRAAALVEATIDFADEDVPVDVGPEVAALVARVEDSLRAEVAGFGAAERIRDGFEVAIVGRPNVGKSTLLNALAGREAAITSAFAGTTRDVIEVRMEIAGFAVTLLDTAGLRETEDSIEALGVERGLSRARAADLRVFLVDGNLEPAMTPEPGDIVVTGKLDLGRQGPEPAVSGLTGEGIAELIDRIGRSLEAKTPGAATIIRARHREAIMRAEEHLGMARERIVAGCSDELVAEDLRAAVRALESLVGKVDVEHLLDDIFASFCIGK